MKKIFILTLALIVFSMAYSQDNQMNNKFLDSRYASIDANVKIKQLIFQGTLPDSVSKDSLVFYIGNSTGFKVASFYQDTVNANGFPPATQILYNKNIVNISDIFYLDDGTTENHISDSLFVLADTTTGVPVPFLTLEDSVRFVGQYQRYNTLFSVSSDTLNQYFSIVIKVDETNKGDLSDRIISWTLVLILYGI